MIFLDFVLVLVVMKEDWFHLYKILQGLKKTIAPFLVANHQLLVSVGIAH